MTLVPALLLAGTLAGALAGAPAAAQASGAGRDVHVAVERDGGDAFATVRADDAPLGDVLEALAAELGLALEGLDGAARPTLVTVHLERRPVDLVLEAVLGSVGLDHRLRGDALEVRPPAETTLPAGALLDLAAASHARALASFPGHPLAPRARLGAGELAELRGLPGAALDHYHALLEDHPGAADAPEARRRAAAVLVELGRWAEAAHELRTLAELAAAGEDLRALARLELARCTIELGDPEGAAWLLASLDAARPLPPGPERAERDLVRARALVETGRAAEALRLLEAAAAHLPAERAAEAMRVRALALEGAGHPAEAGRAWLLVARDVDGPRRRAALERAAELALRVDDPLGALFACREAERLGLGAALEPWRERAWSLLGFGAELDPARAGAPERIAAAERALEADDADRASEWIAGLVPGRGALEAELEGRLVVAWSRCLEHAQGPDRALVWLREARAALAPERADLRPRIDRAAAALLERHGRLDEALDAYRGRY